MKMMGKPPQRRFLQLLLGLHIISTLPAVCNAEEWQLLWSDEFDSDGLNGTNWSPEVGFLGFNGEFQTYTEEPENLRVENGTLQLTAIRDWGAQVGYTSARINSLDKVMMKYATVEASIKIPSMELGLWPAFWTLGEDWPEVGWPQSGELDILEAGQKQGSSEGLGNHRIVQAFHWDAWGQYVVEDAEIDVPFDLSSKFVKYKMVWQPDYIETFVDDTLVYRFRIADCFTLWDCPELHQYHFMVVNLAVAGAFTCCEYGFDLNDNPMGTSWTMEVDYIRIWGNEHTEIILAEPSEAPTQPPTMVPTKAPTEAPVVSTTAEPTAAITQSDTMSVTSSSVHDSTASASDAPVVSSTAATVPEETAAPTATLAPNGFGDEPVQVGKPADTEGNNAPTVAQVPPVTKAPTASPVPIVAATPTKGPTASPVPIVVAPTTTAPTSPWVVTAPDDTVTSAQTDTLASNPGEADPEESLATASASTTNPTEDTLSTLEAIFEDMLEAGNATVFPTDTSDDNDAEDEIDVDAATESPSEEALEPDFLPNNISVSVLRNPEPPASAPSGPLVREQFPPENLPQETDSDIQGFQSAAVVRIGSSSWSWLAAGIVQAVMLAHATLC